MSELVEFGKYASIFPKKKISTDVSLISEKSKELLAFSYNNFWMTPKFKLKWFVGQAEHTPYHIVRQYMLELRAREDSLEAQEYELKKAEILLKMGIKDLENESDELKKELLTLEVKRMTNAVASTQSRVKDLYIERQSFLDLLNEFLASPQGKTPDGRPLTAILGSDEEEGYERQYWTVRLARQGAMDLIAFGRIGAGNLDAIMQLEAGQREECMQLAHTVSLAVDKQQMMLRDRAAESLQISDTGRLQYIGQLDPHLINSAINADMDLIKAANARLDNNSTTIQPNSTLPKEFNEIYNL